VIDIVEILLIFLSKENRIIGIGLLFSLHPEHSIHLGVSVRFKHTELSAGLS